MICGMPILRGHDDGKHRLKPIRHRNDSVTVRHGKRPIGKEIVLDIYQNERFHNL